jgi:hypothetical protein
MDGVRVPNQLGNMNAHRCLTVLRFAILSAVGSTAFTMIAADQITVRDSPPVSGTNIFYVSNRTPLAPNSFVKLPIGSITPRGWLRHQLELERDGMIGRLKEISPWLDFQKSAWASKEGKGERGWEEMPYWLKGYGDLGYVLRDETIIAAAKKWIEAAMASQREDGWFGPRDLLTSLKGKPDLWPHMVMLNILQSYYEFSGDRRVLDVMMRYLKWENALPPSAFGEGYWPKIRAGDNIESAFWLYNRTGELSLLELAKRIHENMQRWHAGEINWHNVNFAQGFRAGTVFWMQSKDPKHRDSAGHNYQNTIGTYGQFAGGTFVADEDARPGYIDPRGGFETCGIVEFMHSFEMLTKITGNPVWADRCEEIAFNSFPASMTPDEKGLHYLTCANQVQLDRRNKAPGVQNNGTMFSYSPFEGYRCCQHNVSHGWPYYAEELWLATPDNGLGASLYAASEVSAKVGDGATVKITEETDYPFSDTIQFKVALSKATIFPLYLRVPRWCEDASLRINGKTVEVKARPLSFIAAGREWKDGDTVTLQLPMKLAVRTWAKNKDSVSVDYGPLSFALAIKERWTKYGDRNAKWPEWEVLPDSPWNYGLVLNAKDPAKSFRIERKSGALAAQPFTPETVPVSLKAQARKIAAWRVDRLNMVGPLQQSPAKSSEPSEEITLIPMGAARLRISSFPTIGDGPGAHEWVEPPKPKPAAYKGSASHCFESDTVDALSDGLEPANSNDHSIPRFTWWPRKGSTEWVQYDFDQPRKVSRVSVYWFDDTVIGQCRVPQSWRLLYKAGDAWKPVEGADEFGVNKDAWNRTKFVTVTTTGLRLEVQLRPEFSSGILEWRLPEE